MISISILHTFQLLGQKKINLLIKCNQKKSVTVFTEWRVHEIVLLNPESLMTLVSFLTFTLLRNGEDQHNFQKQNQKF